MTHIIIILIFGFVASNVIVEAYNIKGMSPLTNPMSAYLAGVPLFWLQDAGYVAMSFALILTGTLWPPLHWIAWICAFAIVMVVGTKLDANGHPEMERLHVICAGIAFVGLEALVLFHNWGHLGVALYAALAGPAVTFLLYRFAPQAQASALEEKVLTIFLCGSLLVSLGG